MITPTADCGAPTASTTSSIAGDSTFASPTTEISAITSRKRLDPAARPDGGSAWLSWATSSSTGRK
jgi:hypothetical protein